MAAEVSCRDIVLTSGNVRDNSRKEKTFPKQICSGTSLFMTIECSQSVHSIVMGFILLRVLEFFVFRKMEMPETKNHLLCGWRQSVVQKNHLSVTIELFRHYCKKGKVILWRIRIMI